MKNRQIYTAGKMGGLLPKEYKKWRNDLTENLFYKMDSDRVDLTVINPHEYFGFEKKLHDNMLEIINWELNAVKNSDVIIVNLDFDNSTGTNIELYTAWQNNIPVIAYSSKGISHHPWVEEFITRKFKNWDTLVEYVLDYHINV